MIIEYKTGRFIKESDQIEIADTKNVFLRGKHPDHRYTTYFGIWIHEETIRIVTIMGWHIIDYKCYLSSNLPVKDDILEYLEHNTDIKIITKDEFKEQVQHIRKIIDI